MNAADQLMTIVPDPTASVHEAIASVIRDLPAVGKDSRIEEGPQRYSYRGIEAIKAALKPVLADNGVHYAPFDITTIDDSTYQTRNGAEWQRVRMVVRYRIYGPDGSFIEAVGRGEGADNSDKACNKAMTVAEKQMLGQVFCIADADGDPDQHRAEEQVAAPAEPVANVTVGGLQGALKRALVDKETAVAWWAANDPGEGPWTPQEADHLIDAAKAWLAAQPAADPKPADPETKPTPAAMKKLMATMKDAGIGDADRHDWASLETKRTIVSFTELTRAEVAQLTDTAAEAIMNGDGQ